MPQLNSGRHVALSAAPYLNALTSGPDDSKYFAIVTLRLNVTTPDALRDHLLVIYYKGTPPEGQPYYSGYCVADILEGRSDWSPEEIEEFHLFLNEPRAGTWLQEQFDEINEAIQNNTVWSSKLLENDLSSDEFDEPMIKRVIIRKSATEANAMSQLRPSRRDAPDM